MILGDFLKALGQIGDPRFRRVLWLGIGLTIANVDPMIARFSHSSRRSKTVITLMPTPP